MAKQFGYTASILKDTNRLVASSQADWTSLKNGSYVIFDDDDDFYKVVDKERFFYIKDFTVSKANEITVEGNTDIKLSLNDNMVLTFKEHEVGSVNIENAGSGYAEGDVLEIDGGTYRTNTYDGAPELAKISIDEVGSNGQVLKVSIISSGVYYEPPDENMNLNRSLELKLAYNLIDKRSMEHRSISQIKFDGKNTVITLNNDLPQHVTGGKLSVDKWELILNINYVRHTKTNSTYRVLTDFTPYLNIPLMKGALNKSDSVFNEAITKLDNEIKKIWDKLGE